jgi:hypothetical protein
MVKMSDEQTQSDQDEMQKLNQIIEDHTEDLMARANVVGVGVGLRQVDGQYTNEKVIVVMVSKKMPIAQLGKEDIIPDEIDGVHVDVQEMGMFSAN